MKVHHQVEQNSEAWFALRCGIPTASEFSKVVTSKGEPSKQSGDYAARLAAEAYAQKPLESFEQTPWMQRGHDLEDEARKAYAFQRDVEPIRVGFFTNDVIDCIPARQSAGASPDSLVGDDGGLEIKCLSPAKHVLALWYWHKNKRCPTDYVAQAQGQILVCELAWVDVWLYHPELPSLAIRVNRDEIFQRNLRLHLSSVVQERDALLDVLKAA